MNIPNAWLLSTGAGTTVGITDTGLDRVDPSEFGPSYASSGGSGGRWVQVGQSYPWVADGAQLSPQCSHGTRISGLVGAPSNGRSTVGVAFGANIYNVYQANGVAPDQAVAAQAIHLAAIKGSRVIVMAWGLIQWSQAVSDEIDSHHYYDNVMFVGASGTCPIGDFCPHMNSAQYPAGKEEVLAVSGYNHDGTRPDNMFSYGVKSGVWAYTNLATTGMRRSDIVTIGGSSGATGVVGGIAALVRARNPGFTARQTMDRIIKTSGVYCGSPNTHRSYLINASPAVGGACVRTLYATAAHSEVAPGVINYYTNDPNEGAFPPVDFYQLVERHFPDHVYGGSGSYQVDWITGPEFVVQSAQDGDFANNGGVSYRSLRTVTFARAWDGQPYRSTVKTRTTDTQWSTVDERGQSVLVCTSQVHTTGTPPVPSLGPPPTPQYSVYIDAWQQSGSGWMPNGVGGLGTKRSCAYTYELDNQWLSLRETKATL